MKLFSFPSICTGIIFDMDNTLYSNKSYTTHQEEVLVQRLAIERGIKQEQCQLEIDLWRNTYAKENNGKKPSLGNIFVNFGVPISTSIKWRSELIKPELFLSRSPELVESMEALSKVVSMAIVTNNPTNIAVKTLKKLGVDLSCFSTIVGLDTTGVSKPDTAAFRIALSALGTAPGQTISVGDRYEIDIEPALSMGMGGVLVDHVSEIWMLPAMIHKGQDKK